MDLLSLRWPAGAAHASRHPHDLASDCAYQAPPGVTLLDNSDPTLPVSS